MKYTNAVNRLSMGNKMALVISLSTAWSQLILKTPVRAWQVPKIINMNIIEKCHISKVLSKVKHLKVR